MNGRDFKLIAGTVAVCGAVCYYWKKIQHGGNNVGVSQLGSQKQETSPCKSDKGGNNVGVSQLGSEKQETSPYEEYAKLDVEKDGWFDHRSSSSDDLEVDTREERVVDQWVDIGILHASDDYTNARECQRILKQNLQIDNLTVELHDDLTEPGTYVLDGIADLLNKCRVLFIFHSRNFKKDGFVMFGKHANIVQSIQNPDKAQRVIPLLTDGEELSSDLSVLSAVEYISDTGNGDFINFRNKIERLIKNWRTIIQ